MPVMASGIDSFMKIIPAVWFRTIPLIAAALLVGGIFSNAAAQDDACADRYLVNGRFFSMVDLPQTADGVAESDFNSLRITGNAIAEVGDVGGSIRGMGAQYFNVFSDYETMKALYDDDELTIRVRARVQGDLITPVEDYEALVHSIAAEFGSEDEIKGIHSLMMLVDGKIVYVRKDTAFSAEADE